MVSSLPDSTYAVLGLVDKGPASGYDLATVADRSLGYFWPVSRTLVYNELARLRDLGWAEAVEVAQERRPDKRVWSSTGAGRDALAEWLLKPVETASTFRSGVLLKFMFGARMSNAQLSSLLSDYRESLMTTADDLGATIEQLRGRPAARMGRLAALHGLRTAEARLGWLDEVEAELEPTDQRVRVDRSQQKSGLRPGEAAHR